MEKVERIVYCIQSGQPTCNGMKEIADCFNRIDRTSLECVKDVGRFVSIFDSILKFDRVINLNDANLVCAYLTAIGSVLYKKSSELCQFHSKLLGPKSLLEKYLNCENRAVQRCAMLCVRNLTMTVSTKDESPLSKEMQRWCFNVCLNFVADLQYFVFDFNNSKLLSGALEGLSNLLKGNFVFDPNCVPKLFGAIASAMSFGLPGLPFIQPVPLIPSTKSTTILSLAAGNQLEALSRKKNQDKKKRLRAKVVKSVPVVSASQAHVDASSSDSDGMIYEETTRTNFIAANLSGTTSDASSSCTDEAHNDESKLVLVYQRIRLSAFKVLELCANFVDPSTLFSYWFRFFPDTSIQQRNVCQLGISQVLLKDNCFKVRMNGVNAVRVWLLSCRSMLACAELRTKPAPFTSFSETLANSIVELFRCLVLILTAEQFNASIVQCLKCLSTLISSTPFEKFHGDLITKTVNQCKQYLYSKDCFVRTAALSVFGAVVKVNRFDEFGFLFLPKEEPWILEICWSLARKNCTIANEYLSNSTQLNVEALQTLIAIYTTHGNVLRDSITTCVNSTFDCLKSTEVETRLHSLKLLNAVLSHNVDYYIFTKDRCEMLERFLSATSSKGSTPIVMETLEIYSKLIEHVDDSSVRNVVSHFLYYSSVNGNLVQTTALRLLPIVMKIYQTDLKFVQNCFDIVLTVLETASANVAEKAGASLIYITRIVALNPSSVEALKKQQFEILERAIARALRFERTSSVVRLKPSCISCANLLLENFSNFASVDCHSAKIGLICRTLIPIILEHSTSEVIKVQQVVMESATILIQINRNVDLIDWIDLCSIVQCVIDVLRVKDLKFRTKLIAITALTIIPAHLWRKEFQQICVAALNALIYSIETLDEESARNQCVENTVIENVAHKLIRCMLVLLANCDTQQVRLLDIKRENVQKSLCYYIDLYKSMLYHQNEFSANHEFKEEWTTELLTTVEHLKYLLVADSNDECNLLILLGFIND